MSYDNASWHTDSCNSKGVDEAYAATHIAVFVKWCAEKGFISPELEEEDSDALEAMKSGNMSACEYFEKFLDWKFGDWSLNEDGNEFASSYYEQYLKDLNDEFPDAIYGPEKGVDYARLRQFLDARLKELKELGVDSVPWKARKPWWKFW